MQELESRTFPLMRVVVKSLKCDICYTDGDADADPLEPASWPERSGTLASERMATATTEVSRQSSYSFYEYQEYHSITFDICPHCFDTKLVPWLESQGAIGRKVDR
jgi:hypothetical protein